MPWDNVVKFPGRRDRSHPPVLTEGEYDALPDHIKAMFAEIVAEKRAASRPPLRQARRGSGVNIRTLCFRSREMILESSEADLVRDACLDLDKAQTKLKAIRLRLQHVQEWSAAQLQLLTTADTKLTAAIDTARLSGQR
jgi:hypothetical protein